MCGIVGVIAKTPVNQLIYDALAAAAAPRPGRRRHRHDAGHQVLHAQGARHGARRLPHAQHARAAGHRRPRPGALPDGGQRLQRRGGAAVLRQLAVRHRARAQRQPHQRARAEARAVRHRPPPHQHRVATPRCCSTCSRTSSSAPRATGSSTPDAIFTAVAAVHRRVKRLVRGRRADRRLRPARVPRSVRHPAADLRRRPRRRTARGDASPARSVALDGTGHR